VPVSDAPLRAIGSTTTAAFGTGWGYPPEDLEHVPDLQWPASTAVLAKMRTDSTVQSVLAAYVTALVAADWRINGKGAHPEATAICADSLGLPISGEDADDIGPSRARGVKFLEHVRLACLHLTFGFMPFEDVYEVLDGRVYLKYLAERLPSTITDIKVNPDGTLKGITQTAPPGKGGRNGGVEIPADRLIWYVNDREGANWSGRSLLRAAYAPWLLKIDGLRTNAIGLQRFGAGTPVAEPLPGTNPTQAQIAEAQALVAAIRVGETGGAVPVGFRLRIIGVEGTLPDALPTLQYYDQSIARSTHTSLLDLGNTATGSRALGDNFADLLQRSLQSIGRRMAETASQLCVRLTSYNFGEDAVPPTVECGDVGASKATIAQSIQTLMQAGALTPDESLEAFIRDGYRLPPADPRPAPAPVPATEPPVQLQRARPAPTAVAAAGGADRNRGNAENLRRAFLHGDIAARIRYGTPGQFDRCVAIASKHMTGEQAKGYCANRIKEATGEWPGAHRVAAAEPQPYREPTPAEQAAGLDPAAIDETQDGLVAEGMALFTAIVAVWGAALAAQITAALAANSLAALARLRVDSTDAAQGLAVLMREAAGAGVGHVLDEGIRAGIPRLPGAQTIPGVQVNEAALDDAAEATAELMGQGLARAAGREAARLASPEADPKATARAAVDAASASNTPIHDSVWEAVARGMGVGRRAAQERVAESAPGLVVMASALRDRNTCGPCLENDQARYPDVPSAYADFPAGHYKACLGRGRCRCLLVLVPNPEVP
jgi:hypothetical protein